MAATKVLVVDDSMTMRVLISGALERVPNVDVVGLANGADEAREMVERFRPDVMTLDIEMPGTSGLQYLAEIMEKRPMPVIMFSTRTQTGDSHSAEALRLGAVACFPKPKVAAPAELDKIIDKLGKCIKSAKTLAPPKSATQQIVVSPPIDWNGRLLAIGGDASCTKAICDLLATFPANCPPTVVVQHLDAGIAATVASTLDQQIAPRVVIAEDGMAVEQGSIYIAASGDSHIVVDGWPNATLRKLARDPVAGERPSISVLFASLARAATSDSVSLMFAADAEDGRAGIAAVQAAEGYMLQATGTGGFELKRKQMAQPVALADLGKTALKLCSK